MPACVGVYPDVLLVQCWNLGRVSIPLEQTVFKGVNRLNEGLLGVESRVFDFPDRLSEFRDNDLLSFGHDEEGACKDNDYDEQQAQEDDRYSFHFSPPSFVSGRSCRRPRCDSSMMYLRSSCGSTCEIVSM